MRNFGFCTALALSVLVSSASADGNAPEMMMDADVIKNQTVAASSTPATTVIVGIVMLLFAVAASGTGTGHSH